MKVIDIITSRLLLKFLKISSNIKFPENLQPQAHRRHVTSLKTIIILLAYLHFVKSETTRKLSGKSIETNYNFSCLKLVTIITLVRLFCTNVGVRSSRLIGDLYFMHF